MPYMHIYTPYFPRFYVHRIVHWCSKARLSNARSLPYQNGFVSSIVMIIFDTNSNSRQISHFFSPISSISIGRYYVFCYGIQTMALAEAERRKMERDGNTYINECLLHLSLVCSFRFRFVSYNNFVVVSRENVRWSRGGESVCQLSALLSILLWPGGQKL